MAIAASSIERMAVEFRHLQRTEVLEVQEPFKKGQRGSSAMPHKKNPNLCERICGLARLLRAYALTGFENVALWHERDISHSSVERVTLADASILLDYMIHRMNWIIQNLVVYPERMRKNLNASNGLVFSQKVLLLLTRKGMSREDAYRIVQSCALRVWDTELNLLDVLKEHAELKSRVMEPELEECFDLEGTLMNIDLIFERLGLV